MSVRSSTHIVEIRADVVIKRYRSWRWGEPEREWRALTLLAGHAPGLAPEPVGAELTGDPPVVVMSRLAGDPLAAPVTPDQTGAVAEAFTTVLHALPPDVLADLPPRAGHPPVFLELVRTRAASKPDPGPDPLVGQAFGAALDWLGRSSLDDMVRAEMRPVLGTGDGNVANYLWDGTRARIVDFEFSGRSDRAFELAELAEHISWRADGPAGAPPLVRELDLTAAERPRLRECRRLLAVYWLLALLPAGTGHDRNPPETLARQARHLLDLLG